MRPIVVNRFTGGADAIVIDHFGMEIEVLLRCFGQKSRYGPCIVESEDVRPSAVIAGISLSFGGPHQDSGVAWDNAKGADVWPGEGRIQFLHISAQKSGASFFRVVREVIIDVSDLVICCVVFGFKQGVVVVHSEVEFLFVFKSTVDSPSAEDFEAETRTVKVEVDAGLYCAVVLRVAIKAAPDIAAQIGYVDGTGQLTFLSVDETHRNQRDDGGQ